MLKTFWACLSHLTWRVEVANCISLVTLVPRDLGQLPTRLQAAGWVHPLRVRGAVPHDVRTVAIVGSRAATAAAMDHAHRLGQYFAEHGVHVVSGGALGVDGAAHRGALAGGGTTTVVLGSGVNVLYPLRHAALFDRVLAAGGGLVSMLPDEMPPRAATFPQRNPLIAALADLVIVVAAEARSGSLSTANAARKIGRRVAAWPGSAGCDRLLASGAGLIESEHDAALALAGTPRMREHMPLDPIEARVCEAIARGHFGIDSIVAHTGLSVRAVLRALPAISDVSPAEVVARKQ